MYLTRFWIESEDPPKDINPDQVENAVKQSLDSLPVELTQCEVVERDVMHNGQPLTKRICLVSVTYPELREIEEVFSDIKRLDDTGFNFSRWDTRSITALIPELHPTLLYGVHKSWGRVDGYEQQRPPDRTSASVSIYGEITSEEVRSRLNEIATHVFEPKEVEPGKYECEHSFGKSIGSTPEIEVYKVWPEFNMRAAETFVYRVREIDRQYHITNPILLLDEEQEWIATRYPPAVITGNFWRDTRNDIYWLQFQISQLVHFE